MECSKCNTIKPVAEFGKRQNYASGYDNYCKPCRRAYTNARRKANPEKESERNAKRREERARNPKRKRIPEDVKKARASAYERERYKRRSEVIKSNVAEWKRNNPHKTAAYKAKRKAAQLKATPPWANHGYIELWYLIARMDEECLGVKCHVDHIIPLIHPLVCGLHCEDNLQVLTASENCSKQNKWKTDWE